MDLDVCPRRPPAVPLQSAPPLQPGHTALWAAHHAARLDGDFVACGANAAPPSLAICHALDFNRLDRDFWLFGASADTATAFAPWPRAWPIHGAAQTGLAAFPPGRRVAYLSIGATIALPEIAALEFFWPRLVPAAVVLFEPSAWETRRPHKPALDAFAAAHGAAILSLPTGQGLLIR